MIWNWQLDDWPDLTWDDTRLVEAEQQFLVGGGVILGSLKHLGDEERIPLTIEVLSNEAMTTSEIEGEILDRPSVQSSIRKQFGLVTESRRVPPSEFGIAEMMVDVYRSFEAPLTQEGLFAWHTMVTNGRRDLKDIGRYRTSEEPMQVVSGRLDKPTIHFEAPPSAQVPLEMARFIDWFNARAAQGSKSLPPLTRAGVAHLYFESIHPFEDGNGRIGRALAVKALAQGLTQPTLIALSATLLARRKTYYQALEDASKRNEITEWLTWFAQIVLEAQQRTLAQTEFIISKAKLLKRLDGLLNERQEKALLRIFREGSEGFLGGLSASNYRAITGASQSTTTRDLFDLTEKGALTKVGDLKKTRYYLKMP